MNSDDFSGLGKVKCNFEAFMTFMFAYLKKNKPGANTIIFKGDKIINFYYEIDMFNSPELNIEFISIFSI